MKNLGEKVLDMARIDNPNVSGVAVFTFEKNGEGTNTGIFISGCLPDISDALRQIADYLEDVDMQNLEDIDLQKNN